MKDMPPDTREEFEYRLRSEQKVLNYASAEDAKPKLKTLVYHHLGLDHYAVGILLQMTGRDIEARESFSKVVPLIKTGLAYSLNSYEEIKLQCELFKMSLLTGNLQQIEESAVITKKIAEDLIDYNRVYYYYVALVHLYLQQPEEAMKLLPEIRKLEAKKSEKDLKLGVVDAIQGICSKDENMLIAGLTKMLDGHHHELRYLRWALSAGHFVSVPATMLCIIALRYGMDVKSKLTNAQVEVKTRTEYPEERSELPSTKRFVVPADYIPEYMLSPWREYWNIN